MLLKVAWVWSFLYMQICVANLFKFFVGDSNEKIIIIVGSNMFININNCMCNSWWGIGGGIQETSKTLKQRINESKDGDIIDAGKEEIDIKDGDSYTIDKAITIRNCDAKSGTFIVEATGARFENLRNIESIIADERLGEGDLDIRNCFEIDSVYVNGGGSHSIRIASTHIKNLYVAKEDVRVLLQAEGTNAAKVENVQISKNCKLESEDAAAVFEQVQISADVEKVTLAGSATVQKILAETVVTEESTEETKAKVEIESSEVKIEATSANVELKVSENADANVTVPETQIIEKTFKVTTVVNGETSSLAVYEGYKFNFKPGDADSGFAGWYSDAAFTTKIELPYLVTKDVTLYAKFVELKANFFVVSNGVASSAEANKYYSDVTVGKVEGATIATTSDYDVITVDNATATSDVWSVWADSLENWNFKANKNYKISVDVKADTETVLVISAHAKGSYSGGWKRVKVGTDWQTVEIETGCWNKDFLGHLQVACGQSKKTYLKNIKMQEISIKTIPTGNWGPNADSISVTQVENGIKFTSGIEAKEWENGVNIEGNFVETSKNYLYKITFTAVADANDVKLNYSADAVSDENVWGSATIGKTATNIELYMPAYQLDGDELRGAELDFSLSTKNSVTITNVKFEPLTAIPSNQAIFFTSDYKVYKKITSTGKDNCIELEVPANAEADLRFVMEKATNSKIEWNNSCSFSKFVNKTSATVSIPDGKDYLVLKNTSNASQSYRLYIDETWTIVIEDATTTPAVEYTITYVSTEEVSGIFMESETLPAGTVHELPQLDDIPDDDYPKRFGGWYEGVTVNEYGSFDWTNATKVSSSYTVTKDVTLYAAWVMDVTITFVTGYEADGIIVDPIKTETYAKINLPTPTAPTGMTFEGWYCDGDNDDEIIWEWAEKESSPYMVNRPRTLFAKWNLGDAPVEFNVPEDVTGLTITKTDSETVVENSNYLQDSSEWDSWIISSQQYSMNSYTSYKFSVEVKDDSEKEVIFRVADFSLNEAFVQEKATVNTEWNVIEIITGSWQAALNAQLQVYMGQLDKLYLRNLKVEKLGSRILPVVEFQNSVLSDRTENGFTVQIDNTDEWVCIKGQIANNEDLYLVSFDVVSEDETKFNFAAKASSGKYADAWYNTTIGTTSTKIELYVPYVGSDSEAGFDFMDIGFSSSVATTLTISNFEVNPVPMEENPAVVIALQGDNNRWDQFMGYPGSGTSFTLAAGESVQIYAHIGAENFDNWDVVSEVRKAINSNFCSVSVNSENRPVITNDTDIDRRYKLWISDYLLVITDDQTYSVTFDPNGGAIAGNTSAVTKEVYELLDVVPVKEGYTFLGWFDADGNLVSEIQSGITVYAEYTNNLEIFANGEVVGDFSVVQDENGGWSYSETAGIPFTSEGDGVYSATFTYQDYMNGWASPSGTCAFKARTVVGSWAGTSYGVADNHPVIDGEAVSSIIVQSSDIIVSGFVDGTTYKITFTCAEDGSVTVKVSTVTE